MSNTNRILAVVDPTADEQPAVQRAAMLASRSGAELELFICFYDQYLAGERFFDSPALQQTRNDLLNSYGRQLEEQAAALRDGGLTVTTQAVWDTPLHEGIVRRAVQTHARLVVKDTHFHSGLRRSIFSNTDWNLIRTCPVPLLLVKPGEYPSAPLVLAAVDPVHEHDKPAALDHLILQHAEECAADLGGEVHVLHCFDPMPAIAGAATTIATPITVPVDEITEEIAKQHQGALDELVKDYELAPQRIHMERGPARDLLPEEAEKLKASLVVMGAVSRGTLQRIFVGSTAEQVLDRLPCDVLVIKPEDFDSPVTGSAAD